MYLCGNSSIELMCRRMIDAKRFGRSLRPDNKRPPCHAEKCGFYPKTDGIKDFRQGKLFWQ